MKIEKKLEELNITLPEVAKPIANYVGYVKTGNLVYISGQLPMLKGELKYVGKLGKNLSIEEGKRAAEICAINLIAQLKKACKGNLDKVEKCVKLGIFVNSTTDFIEQSAVGNGASDLIGKVFGERGKHARFAVGVAQLPKGASVEIDGVFEIV